MSDQYPPFYLTADLVVLTLRDGRLHLLLVRRGVEPFLGQLALPGGFALPDEDLLATAQRELLEECGITPDQVLLEQLRSYGRPNRDPRHHRVVSVAWLAMGADLPEPQAGTDAVDALWVPLNELDETELAFDHAEIVRDGVERARARLEYSGDAAAFCRPEFTVAELREVYQAVWGVELDKANFHRKVTGAVGFLRPTGERTSRGGGRPAMLYTADASAVLHPAILRP